MNSNSMEYVKHLLADIMDKVKHSLADITQLESVSENDL